MPTDDSTSPGAPWLGPTGEPDERPQVGFRLYPVETTAELASPAPSPGLLPPAAHPGTALYVPPPTTDAPPEPWPGLYAAGPQTALAPSAPAWNTPDPPRPTTPVPGRHNRRDQGQPPRRGARWVALGVALLAFLTGVLGVAAWNWIESSSVVTNEVMDAVPVRLYDGQDWSGVDFSNEDLTMSSFVGTILNDADFSNTYLDSVNFRNATAIQADFSNAAGSSLEFFGATLTGADFSNTSLPSSDFSHATIIKANFSNADLSGSEFVSANLTGTDLSNATLSGDLQGANFTGADLSNADLNGSTLYGADFTGADLSNVNLDGAHYDDTTIWPNRFTPPESAIHD